MSARGRSCTRYAVGVLAVLALAGCGEAGGGRASERTASGGSWEATLGGEPVELEAGVVDCEMVDGSMHLRIGDIDIQRPSRSTGISAVISAPDTEAQVAAVDFMLPDGRTLFYSPLEDGGIGVPSTEVTVEGDTYAIQGAGTLNNLSGGHATTQFALTVTCG